MPADRDPFAHVPDHRRRADRPGASMQCPHCLGPTVDAPPPDGWSPMVVICRRCRRVAWLWREVRDDRILWFLAKKDMKEEE